MKYFITGATGFIGGRVVRQLVTAGHQVVALARDPARARDLVDLGVEVCQGDILDRESMRQPMGGVDGVFHIAAWYEIGAKDPSMAERINVRGTRNVLELMRELAIPKGVYTSTIAVFGDTGGRLVDETYRHAGPWLSEYDRTKWMAHYEVAEPMIAEGLPLVVVQPGLVYGPGDAGPMRATWNQYLRGRLPAAPSRTAFCWGHVDDTARGHLLAMERGQPGETYIIAGPVHRFTEALAIAEKITGVRAPRLHPSPGVMKVAATLAGLVQKVIQLPPSYTAEALHVTAGVTYIASNAKAQRELGFQPRPLEEGLRETLTYDMQKAGIRPTPT